MKRYILVLWTLMIIGSSYAGVHDNAGEYGYKFLQIPVNPVSMAMAGRGIHSPSNTSSWIMQPASSCQENLKSASAAHSTWIGDTGFSSAWYNNSSRSSSTGLMIRNLSYGEIEKRDETGFLIGSYNPVDIAVTGNHARRLSPWLYAGMNLGVIYQKLDTASSLALASDLGLTLLPPLKDSAISFAVQNLGIANKTDAEAAELPLSFDLAIHKGIELGRQRLSLEAGLAKSSDEDLQAAFSGELSLLERMHLRGGYKLEHDSQSFSAGVGFELSRFVLDYGFAAFDEGLKDVHSFGLRYNF